LKLLILITILIKHIFRILLFKIEFELGWKRVKFKGILKGKYIFCIT
jgi:hypothetical protein